MVAKILATKFGFVPDCWWNMSCFCHMYIVHTAWRLDWQHVFYKVMIFYDVDFISDHDDAYVCPWNMSSLVQLHVLAGSVTVKTFGLLPDRAWIWLDFPDLKHDYIKEVYRSNVCFAGPRSADRWFSRWLLVTYFVWIQTQLLVIHNQQDKTLVPCLGSVKLQFTWTSVNWHVPLGFLINRFPLWDGAGLWPMKGPSWPNRLTLSFILYLR